MPTRPDGTANSLTQTSHRDPSGVDGRGVLVAFWRLTTVSDFSIGNLAHSWRFAVQDIQCCRGSRQRAGIPGAHGRVIAVLLGTSGELNLRTIARVAGVSIAQASRVLPGLVELGMIERREVPPSSMFRLISKHVATRALLDLADSRGVVMTEMGRAASKIRPAPVSVIAFGSFARGDSEPDSDIDVIIVRPAGTDADDDRWVDTIERWQTIVSRLAGNTVEILDLDADAVAAKLSGGTQLWRDIRRDGQVVFGERLEAMADRVNA